MGNDFLEKIKANNIKPRVIALFLRGWIITTTLGVLTTAFLIFTTRNFTISKMGDLLFLAFLVLFAFGCLLLGSKGFPLIKGVRKLNSGLEILIIALPFLMTSCLIYILI